MLKTELSLKVGYCPYQCAYGCPRSTTGAPQRTPNAAVTGSPLRCDPQVIEEERIDVRRLFKLLCCAAGAVA